MSINNNLGWNFTSTHKYVSDILENMEMMEYWAPKSSSGRKIGASRRKCHSASWLHYPLGVLSIIPYECVCVCVCVVCVSLCVVCVVCGVCVCVCVVCVMCACVCVFVYILVCDVCEVDYREDDPVA